MEKSALTQDILDLYARDDSQKLSELVQGALNQHRTRTIGHLETMIEDVEGKLRLTLLELLIKDGGPDLIPLFINCIRTEKNTLYAKSQILMFKEFRHQQALGALLSIENEIDIDLKPTYQRTLGRMLSQFSEQYYMSEFRAGIGDQRRVQFAADMMLRSPHPDFVPFIHERIQEDDLGYRCEGLRVLREMGDDSSQSPLFSMINRVKRQHQGLERLGQALSFPRGDVTAYFSQMVDHAGLDWDEHERRQHLESLDGGDVEDALGQILDGFRLTGDVRKKIKPYIKGLLCGGDPSAFQTNRANSALDEYGQDLEQLLLHSARVMGEIAMRTDSDNFLPKLEAALPPDDPRRDTMIISALAGYRNAGSSELLVEYVNTCSEHQILSHSLDALELYDLAEIPGGVKKLCFDEKEGVLRRKALRLMARWGEGEQTALQLLTSASIAIAADGVNLISEYRLDNCYPQLLEMLNRPIPDSLVVSIIEALSAFPRAQTGRALKPYLLPPYTATIRKVAVNTIFHAGGEERLELIVKSLVQAPAGKATDTIEHFLLLLMREDFPERQTFLLKERESWLRFLEREEQTIWPMLLQLIENLPIDDQFQARAWLLGLRKVSARFTGSERTPEERRIETLIDHLEEKIQQFNEFERGSRTLKTMLDNLKARNPYHRTQALRTLVNNYPGELVPTNETAVNQILSVCSEVFQNPKAAKDTLLQAVALTGKIRHPKLFKLLDKFLEYPNIDVRNAVKKALSETPDEHFTKPLKHIFIMDDSRYITKQLAKVLARAGYEVDFENEVDAGLKGLGARRFDLLILDMVMPRMNGQEFLHEIRRSGHAPEHVLVITSSRNKEELNGLMAMGVSGLLLKPFRMDELLTRIRELSS